MVISATNVIINLLSEKILKYIIEITLGRSLLDASFASNGSKQSIAASVIFEGTMIASKSNVVYATILQPGQNTDVYSNDSTCKTKSNLFNLFKPIQTFPNLFKRTHDQTE